MTSHVAQDAVNGGFASSAGGAGGIVDPEVIQGGPRVVRGSVETTPGGASPSGGTSGESSGESSGGTSGGSALVRQQHGATHALPAVTGPKTADALIGRLSAVMGQVAQRTRRRLAAEQLRRVQGELVFAYWSRMTGHDRALYTPERESRLLARLRENAGDVSELCFTVDGALRDDTIMGRRNDSAGRKYDGIKTVFRDREQVERLMVLARGYAAGKVHPIVAKYLAALEPDDGDGSDALALTAPQEGVA